MFSTFARRAARTAFTNTARVSSTTYLRHGVKTGLGMAIAVGTGAGVLGSNDSYCFWNIFGSSDVDYQQVYKDVAALLDNLDYDDGSYGPVLVRLAWHASGTYNVADGSGGSNFATMRFEPESAHGANAGLKIARDLLEPIKKKYPKLSYGDLWTIAGIAAVQELGGPVIPWRPGRTDGQAANCTPDGRLPDATKGADHIRTIFYRMGLNDQEIVALAGAHALGRCHTDRSGFVGPWTRAPTTFSNEYFVRLVEEKWVEKKTHTNPKTGKSEPWTGPKQYVDSKTGDIMMLPADLVFVSDPAFRKYTERYAKDQSAFFKDFSAAYCKLLELGVPFKSDAKVFNFTSKA